MGAFIAETIDAALGASVIVVVAKAGIDVHDPPGRAARGDDARKTEHHDNGKAPVTGGRLKYFQ